jgi:hypothetical protein
MEASSSERFHVVNDGAQVIEQRGSIATPPRVVVGQR